MSLFSSKRVIWIAGAEAALPERVAENEEEESGDAAELAAYLNDPTPDTVIVIESSRYEFEGEDKARMERVQKYYSCVPAQVEFRPFDPAEARALAQSLAKKTAYNSAWPNSLCCSKPPAATRRASRSRSKS